jgi:hypothetical protein
MNRHTLLALLLVLSFCLPSVAASCRTGGWCPDPDRGSGQTSLPGGNK